MDNGKMIRETTPKSRQKALSPTPILLDLGTWGRFHLFPVPENFKLPHSRKGGGGGRFSKVCGHCGQGFKTNRQKQVFCKAGCRTYDNRLKRAGVVAWLEGRGMTYDKATDLLDLKGLKALSETMDKAGLEWNGEQWAQR